MREATVWMIALLSPPFSVPFLIQCLSSANRAAALRPAAHRGAAAMGLLRGPAPLLPLPRHAATGMAWPVTLLAARRRCCSRAAASRARSQRRRSLGSPASTTLASAGMISPACHHGPCRGLWAPRCSAANLSSNVFHGARHAL